MSQRGKKIMAYPILLMGLVAAGLSVSQADAAMTTLKQVQVSNGSQIDLLFDGKVGKSQARTEFFNDVIQISLNDVSVYPAKISSVNGGPLVKIFAYQYAPKLVRCRLTVNGKAEDFKDKLQIVSNGKVLSLRLAGATAKSDVVTTQAAHPSKSSVAKASTRDSNEKASEAAKVATKPEKSEKNEEQPQRIETAKADSSQAALLERVMKSAPSKSVPVSVVEPREGKHSLSGAKPLPSPMGVLAKLLAVIALFGAMAFVAKKFMHGKGMSSERALNARIAKGAVGGMGQSNWMSALGGFARSAAAGIGRKDKMIEVLSNHHLGPKKSIAVVRIMGRTLVLGVTNDSINLISQISQPNEMGESVDAAEMGDDENVDLEALLADGALNAAMGSNRNAAAAQPRQTRVNTSAPTVNSRALPGMDPRMNDRAGLGASPFAAMVHQEVKKPSTPGVRNQIRSRLEGLKQL